MTLASKTLQSIQKVIMGVTPTKLARDSELDDAEQVMLN
jgi:hypothetical protein